MLLKFLRVFKVFGKIQYYTKRLFFMNFLTIAKDLSRFLWKKKLWWLAPIVLMLIIVAILIVFGQSSVLSPFVYALF